MSVYRFLKVMGINLFVGLFMLMSRGYSMNVEEIESFDTCKNTSFVEISKYWFSHYSERIGTQELVSMIMKKFQEIPYNKGKVLEKFMDVFKQLETGSQKSQELTICPLYPDKIWLQTFLASIQQGNSTRPSYEKIDAVKKYFNVETIFTSMPESALNDNDPYDHISSKQDRVCTEHLKTIEENCILSFNNALQIAPFLLYVLKKPVGWALEKGLSIGLSKSATQFMRKGCEMTFDMLANAIIIYAYAGILTNSWGLNSLTDPVQLALFVKHVVSAFLTIFRMINLKDLKSLSLKDSLIQILLITGMYLFPMFAPRTLTHNLMFKIPMCLSFTAQVHHHWVTKNVQLTYSKIKNIFVGLFNAVEKMAGYLVANPHTIHEGLAN